MKNFQKQSNLKIHTTGVKGGKTTLKSNTGCALLEIDDYALNQEIYVDAFKGQRETYERREQCAITVKNGSETLTFDNYGAFWDALKKGSQKSVFVVVCKIKSPRATRIVGVYPTKEIAQQIALGLSKESTNAFFEIEETQFITTDINDNVKINERLADKPDYDTYKDELKEGEIPLTYEEFMELNTPYLKK